MQKITSFNKMNANALRQELQRVLAEFGVSADLNVRVGSGSYTETSLSIKIEIKVQGEASETGAVINKDLQQAIAQYNLQREKNGMVLCDYRPRQYKFPFIYEKAGKRYKTSAMNAKMLFSKTA